LTDTTLPDRVRAAAPRLPGGTFSCPMCRKRRPLVGRQIRFFMGARAYVCWRHPLAPMAGVRGQ
jgi:hypothetical protein